MSARRSVTPGPWSPAVPHRAVGSVTARGRGVHDGVTSRRP
ncbi:hypothetical protein FM103_18920 [Corynebacterium xerosis]|nr:hypothetical protein FM103_18920 [Corynebacterium xerosis]